MTSERTDADLRPTGAVEPAAPLRDAITTEPTIDRSIRGMARLPACCPIDPEVRESLGALAVQTRGADRIQLQLQGLVARVGGRG